jgi:protein-S-isoprenylcysteine O-methyltransferase Ste14
MSEHVFKASFVTGLIIGSVIRGVYTRRSKRNTIVDDRTPRLEWIPMLVASLGLLFIPLVYLFTSWLDVADYRMPTWAGWVGVAVFAGALLLLWRSHADLGRNWSVSLQIREGRSLVTAGVFRHIRHPMYAAHGLWGIAQALLLHNWIAGPAFLVSFFLIYFLRVGPEEQMMLDHFGEEYRSYMNRTGRIIPRLRR